MATAQTDLVSVSELAASIGINRQNAHKNIKQWGVKRHAGGKVSKSEVAKKRATIGSSIRAQVKAKAPEKIVPEATAEDLNISRGEAERQRAWAKVESDQIELEERKRTLVKADEVRHAFQSIGRMLSTARENLPAQIAPLLIGKNDLNEIELIVRRELRAIDERVSNEIALKFGSLTNA